jgi:serine/threonine protein phosphatase 1
MRTTRETLSLPRAVAADEEIFAIGDIHGRSDLLEALLDVAADAPHEAPVRRLVFTGDLNDRGPDTLGVFATAAAAGARIGAAETIGLMGNHEILMRLALDPTTPARDAQDALEIWLENGGDGVAQALVGERATHQNPRKLAAALRAAAPPKLSAWLEGLRSHYVSGGVLFVHAGVNPHILLADTLAMPWNEPLDQLDEKTHWAWVRGPFLDHRPGREGFFGLFVVHGHTPLDKRLTTGHAEQVERFRLNLDGGSAVTGLAKMAILRGGVAEIVTACAGPG